MKRRSPQPLLSPCTLSHMDEERWIEAARLGDVQSFNCLVERYQSVAYGVAYRTLGNPEDAADAAQEAFLSAYRAIDGFRGGSFKGWLLRIVVNACYDLRRRARRRPAASLEAIVEEAGDAPWADDRAADPEGVALTQEVRVAIERVLAQLPDQQRLAITLVDMQGLSYEEAADVLECAIGTIRSRLARGRARVRDALAEGNLL